MLNNMPHLLYLSVNENLPSNIVNVKITSNHCLIQILRVCIDTVYRIKEQKEAGAEDSYAKFRIS